MASPSKVVTSSDHTTAERLRVLAVSPNIVFEPEWQHISDCDECGLQYTLLKVKAEIERKAKEGLP